MKSIPLILIFAVSFILIQSVLFVLFNTRCNNFSEVYKLKIVKKSFWANQCFLQNEKGEILVFGLVFGR